MKYKNKALYALLGIFFVAAVVFSVPQLPLLKNGTANRLLLETLSRTFFSAFFICLLFIIGQSSCLRFPKEHLWKDLLWCVPCLLVAVVNFPFSALISGSAVLEHAALIPLFALLCIVIGISEELIFRALAHDLIKQKLKRKKNGYLFSVLLSSALFGLWHLVNLLYGAGFGATMLQVGYSFLIGCMLAVTYDKTENIWLCVFLHALFDFGGMLVDYLGYGNVHDTVFWVLTAVFGIICAAHILWSALRLNRRPQPPAEQMNG